MTRSAQARRKFPAIPPSRTKDPAVEKIREALEIGLGDRGDRLDQFVTYRDMVQSKLGKLSRSGDLAPGDSTGIPTTSVGVLTNLTASGAFQNIILSWEGINQPNYAYTEIWRSADDNLGNAVLVGNTVAAVYADRTGETDTVYYWVRAVSTSSNPGPWNATSGTPGKTSPDYETVRDSVTSTEWMPSTGYALYQAAAPTATVIVGGTQIRLIVTVAGFSGATEPDWSQYAIGDSVTDGTVTWQVVEAGKIPFIIDPSTGLVVIDGASLRTASIDDLAVKNVSVGKLFAVSGTMAEVIVGDGEITNAMITNVIQSNNYTADVSGWLINKSGYAEFNNIRARGHIEADTGYIASILQIGGTSYDLAQVVTMAENADTSLFENWIRPNTTLIDGNKIYTGDAYVDTIQIKGQAVTFPRWKQVVGTPDSTSGNDWENIGYFTVSNSGAPVSIAVACSFSGSRSGNVNQKYVTLRIRKGGSQLVEQRAALVAIYSSLQSTTFFYGGITPTALDTSTVAGNRTYYIDGISNDVTCTAWIIVTELKR